MTDHELESLILLWRRWCYWLEEPIGPELVETGSAERFWRSPQCWDALQPRPEAPNEWEGLRVERGVQRLPERHRAVLRMEYLGVATYNGRRKYAFRQPGQSKEQLRDRKRRVLMMAQSDYDQALYDARIMLRNILKA
jgi:hypothetical protein